MQQLVIKGGFVFATHTKDQDLRGVYPGSEIILWDRPLPPMSSTGTLPRDPRTEDDMRRKYRDQRRVAYPTIEAQLDMIYWDAVNDTDDWIMSIHKVKTNFPKPKPKVK